MSHTTKRYSILHKEFQKWDNDEMYFALTVNHPLSVATYCKRILWAEFEHLAVTYCGLKSPFVSWLFNDVLAVIIFCIVEDEREGQCYKKLFLDIAKERILFEAEILK